MTETAKMYGGSLYDLAAEEGLETRILGEEDKEKQAGYIALVGLAKDILETCISILGFEAPEKM